MNGFIALAAIFAVSFVCNLALGVWLLRVRKKPAASYEAQQLLHDLTKKGGAILKIEVVDASNLFLWSARK